LLLSLHNNNNNKKEMDGSCVDESTTSSTDNSISITPTSLLLHLQLPQQNHHLSHFAVLGAAIV
jgi:hypothetical protein